MADARPWLEENIIGLSCKIFVSFGFTLKSGFTTYCYRNRRLAADRNFIAPHASRLHPRPFPDGDVVADAAMRRREGSSYSARPLRETGSGEPRLAPCFKSAVSASQTYCGCTRRPLLYGPTGVDRSDRLWRQLDRGIHAYAVRDKIQFVFWFNS